MVRWLVTCATEVGKFELLALPDLCFTVILPRCGTKFFNKIPAITNSLKIRFNKKFPSNSKVIYVCKFEPSAFSVT